MRSLPPEYLAEIARQIAFVSAFLGGFAAAFMVSLLVGGSPKRIAGWTIGTAAFGASAFIVSVTASVMLVIVLHPNAPADLTTSVAVMRGRVISTLGFMAGIYALLLALGLGGWIRSRRVGVATSVAAAVAAVIVTWAMAGLD